MRFKNWSRQVAVVCGAAVFVFAAMKDSGAVKLQPPPIGGPLPGLTQAELQRFNAGLNQFLQNEGPQTGLGPVFNGVACAQCHQGGAPGGASTNLGVSVVTRIGAIVNGHYSDLESVGGPLIQSRSLREIIPNYPVPPEVVPPQATFISHRITTPVFGMGLVEAIPDATILSRSGQPQPGGVMGFANMVVNPDTGQVELGRFGWKAQHSTTHGFAGDAYRNEMGVTNPSFPTEVLPQGQPIPPGADPVPDPEDQGGDVSALADFMRFTMPPPPLPDTAGSIAGRAIFQQINCTSCHVPSMTTGASPVAALAFKQVNLYSDLLLHHMGSALADGIQQGQASGDQFRTSPLWGLRFRPFLMHDGRARSILEAIKAHGGEAATSRARFLLLSATAKKQLSEFLSRL